MIAARLNYVALDRMDMKFAAKEVAKHMSRPVALDWVKLKRIARCLAGTPRYVERYEWQEFRGHLDAFADSDWAGDKVTRKSTSGGLFMLGGDLIKSWSSTQPIIALSSREPDLYATVKAASQATGLISMLGDFGLDISATVHAESPAYPLLTIADFHALKLKHIPHTAHGQRASTRGSGSAVRSAVWWLH